LICESNIQKQGYDFSPYSDEFTGVVNEALDQWRMFCVLPEYSKKLIPYHGDDMGVGYELKQGRGGEGESKENFDIEPGYQIPALDTFDPLIRVRVLNFLDKALVLTKVTEPLVSKVLKELGLVECEFVHFVRFLHYFSYSRVGDSIALPHIDKGGITIHLYESAEGFEFLSYKKKSWQKVLVPKGNIMVIPSLQIQYESRGKFRALCHRVTATKDVVENGRFAVVCFVRFMNTPRYNKPKFGQLRTLSPGFNYDISHEKFSDFLKV